MTSVNLISTILFLLAVAHTLGAPIFTRLGNRYPDGSIRENFFHLLGEIEIVFGLWAGISVVALGCLVGLPEAMATVNSLSFAEPLFVSAIMIVAATSPVTGLASALLLKVARSLPLPIRAANLSSCLILGPLLGSLITEPAAMTVTALIMKDLCFTPDTPTRLRYAMLGWLFVNISIGGVLTHFAAPPVIMVATKWGWNSEFMFSHFGIRALGAVLINVLVINLLFRKFLWVKSPKASRLPMPKSVPYWLLTIHLLTLGLLVMCSHFPVFVAGILMFFLGVTVVTKEYQSELRLKDALLVGFFLSGLIVLGTPQSWWIAPLLKSVTATQLLLGSTLLTAVMDNAAITYLAAQVPGIAFSLQYAVVSGAVVGGGMTLIANAPNLVGYTVLKGQFEGGVVGQISLGLAALIPTIISLFCFWL